MCCLLLKVCDGCVNSELMGREKASWKMANDVAAEPILFLWEWIFCSFPKSDLLRLIEQIVSLPLACNSLRTVQVIWLKRQTNKQKTVKNQPPWYRNIQKCTVFTADIAQVWNFRKLYQCLCIYILYFFMPTCVSYLLRFHSASPELMDMVLYLNCLKYIGGLQLLHLGLCTCEINRSISVDQISSHVAHYLHEILKCISIVVTVAVQIKGLLPILLHLRQPGRDIQTSALETTKTNQIKPVWALFLTQWFGGGRFCLSLFPVSTSCT